MSGARGQAQRQAEATRTNRPEHRRPHEADASYSFLFIAFSVLATDAAEPLREARGEACVGRSTSPARSGRGGRARRRERGASRP